MREEGLFKVWGLERLGCWGGREEEEGNDFFPTLVLRPGEQVLDPKVGPLERSMLPSSAVSWSSSTIASRVD